MTPTDEATTPRLAALGGQRAPAVFTEDLDLLRDFGAEARDALWSLLGPSLAEPIPDRLNGDAAAFAEAHGVRPDVLARVVRSARALVRAAVTQAIDGDTLARDLASLVGAGHPAIAVLRAGYDAACTMLRREYVAKTLRDHGPVLTGLDWRVDALVASPRGAKLDTAVVLLTLKVEEDGQTKRITVQALPETLAALHQALGGLLGQR